MLRIGIVAHPRRKAMAEKLFADVDADVIRYDNSKRRIGCEANHRRVWADLVQIAKPGDWLVVLEDDAVPVPCFRTSVTAALKHAPSPVVSLYLGQGRPSQWLPRMKQAVARADREDASWIVGDATIHGVGIAILGPDLVEEMLHKTVLYKGPIDQRMSMWLRQFQMRVAYTFPSLVDHADVETVIEQHPDGRPREKGRVAWRFGNRTKWSNRRVPL